MVLIVTLLLNLGAFLSIHVIHYFTEEWLYIVPCVPLTFIGVAQRYPRCPTAGHSGGSALSQVFHCQSLGLFCVIPCVSFLLTGWLCVLSGVPLLLTEVAFCGLRCHIFFYVDGFTVLSCHIAAYLGGFLSFQVLHCY